MKLHAHKRTSPMSVCTYRKTLRVLATRSMASYYYLSLNNVNGNAWLFTIPHNTCRVFPQSGAGWAQAQEVWRVRAGRVTRTRETETAEIRMRRNMGELRLRRRHVVAVA